MESINRAFKGIWIPADIWLNKNITLMEKVFLVEIDSLDNNEGCFASNDYFSKFFGLSKNRCSEVIKSLEKKELVNIDYSYKPNTKLIEKRIIKVLDKSNIGTRNLDRGIRNLDRGYSENCEDNNTLSNNTINNNIYCLVIKKLNDLANKNFKGSSSKTQKLIKARINEGFTLEDFYKVIENKTATWKNDPKMDQYLRPDTLFGTKFEGYLNEKVTKQNKFGGENNGKYQEYAEHLDREGQTTISNEEAARAARELGIEL